MGTERDPAAVRQIAGVLRDVFLLRTLSEAERLLIAPYFERHTFSPGDVLAREGEPGDDFYLVTKGTVRLTHEHLHLTDVEAGGHFGELVLARPVSFFYEGPNVLFAIGLGNPIFSCSLSYSLTSLI